MRAAGHSRGAGQDTLVYGGVMPVALYLFTMTGFVSNYAYRPVAFYDQYSHGVYRYRFLARDLISGLATVLNGLHLTGATSRGGALFVPFLVLGSLSLAGLGVLLFQTVVAEHPEAWTSYVVLMVVLVLSEYTVTPYDLPSYLLIAATCLAAFGPRPRHPALCALLAVASTCTRESSFLAAAACVAVCWAHDRPHDAARIWSHLRSTGPDGLRWRNAVSVSAATAGSYVALHVVLAPGGSQALWAGPGLARNLSQPIDLLGLVTASLAAVVVWRGHSRLGVAPLAGPARRALWALSSPYLLVCALGGIWFEAPRLLAPLLVCEVLVVAACRAPGVEAPPGLARASTG